MSDPNTDPIPAPDPATPTVAAPAPMNFAAESISLRTTEVERDRQTTETGRVIGACKSKKTFVSVIFWIEDKIKNYLNSLK